MLASISSILVTAVLCGALLAPAVAAAEVRIDQVNARPRMLFAPGEYDRFREETRGARRVAFDRLVAEIQSRGTRNWNERDLQLESQALAARVLLDRGDPRGQTFLTYARNSLQFYLTSHTYVRFTNSHDIVTMGYRWIEAVVFAHDWLYPYWTGTERQVIGVWLQEEIDHWVDSRRLERASPSPFRNDAARGVVGLFAAGLALFDESGFQAVARKALDHATPYYEEMLQAHAYAGLGGGMAEGTFYGNFTAWSQVVAAELLFTAAGDAAAYTRSPFYTARLQYAIFASWPGVLSNSSNQRVHQLAPVFGDARRGPTGSALYHRATVLLLGKRLASTRAAAEAYWAVNRPEVDRTFTAEWSLYDVLFWSPDVQPAAPTELGYREQTLGQVFGRSDWTDQATWFSFNAGPHLDTHQHYDAGNLTIYKGTDLIVDSGSLDTFGSSHWYNYYARTVAHNTITITDPAEKWRGIWSGVPEGMAVNDGGQRTQSPLTPAPTLGEYLANRVAYDHGQITRYGTGPWGVYARADLTNAYQNERFQALRPDNTLNRPKAAHVGREVLFLRRGEQRRDAFIVFDRVIATDPSFRKAVLWHAREPFQTDARMASGDDVERVFSVGSAANFTSRVTFSEGNQDKRGRIHVTVLPLDGVRVRQIGRRVSTGSAVDHVTSGTSHHHRHEKDFYVADSAVTNPDRSTGASGRTEWPPFVPQELPWLFRDELTGGWGQTRLEVEPTEPRAADRFVTVLVPTEAEDTAKPDATLVRARSGDAAAVVYGNQIAIFSTEPSGGDLGAAQFELPIGDADVYVMDLAPGLPYAVTARSFGGMGLLQIAPSASGAAADAAGMLVLRLGSGGLADQANAVVAGTALSASLPPAITETRPPAPSSGLGQAAPRPTGPRARSRRSARLDVKPATTDELIAWERQIDDLLREGVLRVRDSAQDRDLPGRVHERLEQFYRGVPVYGGELARQSDGRRTLWLSGTLYRELDLDVRPRLLPAAAASAARRAAGLPEDGQAASPRLTVLPLEEEETLRYVLVYEIRLLTPRGPAIYMVDAQHGHIVQSILRY
jgi:hypothetical protein